MSDKAPLHYIEREFKVGDEARCDDEGCVGRVKILDIRRVRDHGEEYLHVKLRALTEMRQTHGPIPLKPIPAGHEWEAITILGEDCGMCGWDLEPLPEEPE